MKKNLLKTVLLAGGLAALLLTTYSLLLAALDLNPFGRHKYLYLAIYAIPYAFGMWYFRDKLNNFRLRPQHGIVIGLGLSLVAAVLYFSSMFFFLDYTERGQEVVILHKEQSLELLVALKETTVESMGQEAYDTAYREIGKLDANALAKDAASGLLITGVFHTFLFMLIFKH